MLIYRPRTQRPEELSREFSPSDKDGCHAHCHRPADSIDYLRCLACWMTGAELGCRRGCYRRRPENEPAVVLACATQRQGHRRWTVSGMWYTRTHTHTLKKEKDTSSLLEVSIDDCNHGLDTTAADGGGTFSYSWRIFRWPVDVIGRLPANHVFDLPAFWLIRSTVKPILRCDWIKCVGLQSIFCSSACWWSMAWLHLCLSISTGLYRTFPLVPSNHRRDIFRRLLSCLRCPVCLKNLVPNRHRANVVAHSARGGGRIRSARWQCCSFDLSSHSSCRYFFYSMRGCLGGPLRFFFVPRGRSCGWGGARALAASGQIVRQTSRKQLFPEWWHP